MTVAVLIVVAVAVLGSVLVRYAPKRAGQPRRENVSVGTCVCVAMCAAPVPGD
jgi:hypothetical protein